MADGDVIERPKEPPIEETGGVDVSRAPSTAPTAPEPPAITTPSQRAAELNVQILEHQVQRWPEEDRLRRESQERQAEAERQQAEYNKRIADEQIRDIQEQRQWRKEHPRPEPPTIPPAPQFHLTPPPGLFGHDDAPGNQWMDALTLVGAMGSGTDRRSAMTAMVAMTGMLEGWAKGQKQVFDEKYNAWKDSVGAIEKNYTRQTEYYNNILADNKMSMEEKKQELALGAVAFKDAITYELAAQGRLDQTDKLWKERADTVEKLAKAEKDFDKQIADGNIPGGLVGAAETYNRTGILTGRNSKLNLAIQQQADTLLEQQGIATPEERQSYREQNILRWKRQQAAATTEGRVVAQRTANLEVIEQRLAYLIPDALAASEAVPRSRYRQINQIVQAWQRGAGNPRLAAFAAASFNLADTWALSQKPTGVLDVTLRNQALERLSTADSKEVYATVANQIVREIIRNYQGAKAVERGEAPEVPAIPGAYVPPGQQPLPGQGAPPAPAVSGTTSGGLNWSLTPGGR